MAIIKIFNENDRIFNTNGNIVINPRKCKEIKKKSLNGWYVEVECDVRYREYIEQDKLCVVKTKSKLNPQAFRINNVKIENSIISFTANHVMFDAEKYFLVDVRPTKQNAQNALSNINERTDKASPFSIYSNVGTQNTAYFIRKNMLEAWATIEERWGGVFDADNWNIKFLKQVGNDNGETISYGKNMQGIQIFEDWSAVCTKIYPVGPNELMLDEEFIESDIQYTIPYTRTITFSSDLEAEEGQEISEQELKKELREKAEKYLETNKYPQVSYEVTSDVNQNMEIGDIIHVKHPLVNLITEVQEYTHNILTGKIETLVFGNYRRDVKNKFDGIRDNIKNMEDLLYDGITRQDIVIKQQTDLINSLNKNGYVYIDDNEILILDALPKENARNVWRFGLGGIGFSSNGYEGPFEVAMTMDGQINANFITTGTMSTARIEGLQNALNGFLVSIQLNSDNIQSLVEKQSSDKEELQTLITQTSTDITSEVNEKFKDYDNSKEVDSKIKQESDNITSSVNTKFNNYYNKQETETKITQSTESISSEVKKKVDNSEWSTKLQQSSTDIQMAWNNISQYIQFISASLRIMDSSNKMLLRLNSSGLYLYDTDGSTSKMILNRSGQQFYEGGEFVGKIGTNSLRGYSDVRGLNFDLDTRGSYMTWACLDNPSNSTYTMKLWYARPNTGNLEEGLCLGTDLNLNNRNIIVDDNTSITKWTDGGGFKAWHYFYVTGGNDNTLMALNTWGPDLSFYCDLDMHNYNIKNANNVASDGRLKKNIYSSKINALDRIMQIKHREFAWKKDEKQEDIGYIAQELERIDKTYVQHNYKEDEEGNIIEDCYELRHTPLIATATKAIQELKEIIDVQQKQINILMENLNIQQDIPRRKEDFIEEPETVFEGDVVMEKSKILTPVSKHKTVMKYLNKKEVEIYQEPEMEV